MVYLQLLTAIILEVLATTALKFSEGFTRPLPSVVVLIGYSGAFYFLSLCLQTFSIGVVYAIWSGVGICLTALLGFLVFQQRLDLNALLGMGFIVVGVVIMNFSSSVTMH